MTAIYEYELYLEFCRASALPPMSEEQFDGCARCGHLLRKHYGGKLRCPSGWTGKQRTYSNKYSFKRRHSSTPATDALNQSIRDVTAGRKRIVVKHSEEKSDA